jgi:hypothetical protein
MSRFTDARGLNATSRELLWQAPGGLSSGLISIDTLGTKAVIGFSAGETITFDDIAFTPEPGFIVAFMSALDLGSSNLPSTKFLLSVFGRKKFPGRSTDTPSGSSVPVGSSAIRIEFGHPVRVTHLDIVGRKTGEIAPVGATANVFLFEPSRGKSPYFLIEIL